MEPKNLISGLWNAIDRRRWHEIADYFCSDAAIFWHNTNERFTVPEFVETNSNYPGQWTIQVERLEEMGDLVISVVDVALAEGGQSCHAVSFFELEGGRIRTLHEYWGDNGRPPQWRIDRKIGNGDLLKIRPRQPCGQVITLYQPRPMGHRVLSGRRS